jgi:hypothetical protein
MSLFHLILHRGIISVWGGIERGQGEGRGREKGEDRAADISRVNILGLTLESDDVPDSRNLGMLVLSACMVTVSDRIYQSVFMSSVCILMLVLAGRGGKGDGVGPGGFLTWGS